MKYYSQYRIHDLYELQESLSGLSKSNRWVKLADRLPWPRIENEYNKRLRNSHCGAGNKPARMIVWALIMKHVENLSDEKPSRPSSPSRRIRTCNICLGFPSSRKSPCSYQSCLFWSASALTRTSLSHFRKNRFGGPQKESCRHHRRPRGSFDPPQVCWGRIN